MAAAAPSLPVLYGSQTGTAEDIAWVVARRLVAAGFAGVGVGSIDSYGIDNLRAARHAVFVVSTTGQGDAPDNMAGVWAELRRKQCTSFEGLRFAVLGLGDSSYEKYNYIGKMLHNRLRQLQAVSFCDKGLCDDQDVNGLDDALGPWMEQLVETLSAADATLHKAEDAQTGHATTPTPTQLRYIARVGAARAPAHADPGAPPAAAVEGAPHVPVSADAVVTANMRMTPADHWQAVHEVRMKVSDAAAAAMQPGCSLGITPHNPRATVAAALKRLGLTGDERVDVDINPRTGVALVGGAAGYAHVSGMTVETLLTEGMDLCGVPRRRFFALCAERCANADEKAKLEELGSAEGAEDLRFYCTRERRGYIEALGDFPSVDVTLDFLLEAVPPQKVRQYSISSMPSTEPALTVAVVEYKTPYGRPRVGLCSTYLARLAPNARIRVSIHPPTVSFPDPATPVLLIGPGTGIAPCRSFIQHQHAHHTEAARGRIMLLFGCRNKAKDFLYGEEFAALCGGGEEGTSWLAGYRTAFSRDQEKKHYVQDVIRGDESVGVFLMRTLLEDGGAVYISGSAKNMPQSVEMAIIFCFMKYTGASEDDATDMLNTLKKAKQIQYDTWS